MVEKHLHAIAIKVVAAVILGGPQQVSQSSDLPGIVNEFGRNPDLETFQVTPIKLMPRFIFDNR